MIDREKLTQWQTWKKLSKEKNKHKKKLLYNKL